MGPAETLFMDWSFEDSIARIVLRRHTDAVDAAGATMKDATGEDKLAALMALTAARAARNAAKLDLADVHRHFTQRVNVVLADP